MNNAQTHTPDTLITYYLHITSLDQFTPSFASDSATLTILRMGTVDLAFYKFMYSEVGKLWRWRDRIIMPESELHALLSRDGTSVYVLYVQGVPAGYFELVRDGDSTQLAYFGLREAFTGQGLGKHLLSCAIQQAFHDGAERIWVHTCNLDAPGALDNYQKRGFMLYETVTVPMPQRYS
jgi:GNAT superfamily N-acetyltransferase